MDVCRVQAAIRRGLNRPNRPMFHVARDITTLYHLSSPIYIWIAWYCARTRVFPDTRVLYPPPWYRNVENVSTKLRYRPPLIYLLSPYFVPGFTKLNFYSKFKQILIFHIGNKNTKFVSSFEIYGVYLWRHGLYYNSNSI